MLIFLHNMYLFIFINFELIFSMFMLNKLLKFMLMQDYLFPMFNLQFIKPIILFNKPKFIIIYLP